MFSVWYNLKGILDYVAPPFILGNNPEKEEHSTLF